MPTPDKPPAAVATAVFSVPGEDVWRYRLDFANLPEYNPDVSGVERVCGGEAGANEAYEEFVVTPLDGVVAAAATSSLAQITKELRLMKEVLEGRV